MESCGCEIVQKIGFMKTLGGDTEILKTMKKLQVFSTHVRRGMKHDFRSGLLHNGCDTVDQFRPMFEA